MAGAGTGAGAPGRGRPVHMPQAIRANAPRPTRMTTSFTRPPTTGIAVRITTTAAPRARRPSSDHRSAETRNPMAGTTHRPMARPTRASARNATVITKAKVATKMTSRVAMIEMAASAPKVSSPKTTATRIPAISARMMATTYPITSSFRSIVMSAIV